MKKFYQISDFITLFYASLRKATVNKKPKEKLHFLRKFFVTANLHSFERNRQRFDEKTD